jgi:hypothetical protein
MLRLVAGTKPLGCVAAIPTTAIAGNEHVGGEGDAEVVSPGGRKPGGVGVGIAIIGRWTGAWGLLGGSN